MIGQSSAEGQDVFWTTDERRLIKYSGFKASSPTPNVKASRWTATEGLNIMCGKGSGHPP